MPKLKTQKSVSKRFSITKTGEFLRRKAFRSHLLAKKAPGRKRQLRKATLVNKAHFKQLSRVLPYK